jgi:hypothetical protein
VPKLTDRNLRAGFGRQGRKRDGKVAQTFGLLMFLGMVVLLIVFLVSQVEELPYRAGWSGVPGTVSAVFCETEGSGKSTHLVCDGEFRQTGGSTPPVAVTIEGSNYFDGNRGYPARLQPDGQTVSVVGSKTVVYLLAGMAGTLAILSFLGGYLVLGLIMFIRRRLGRFRKPSKFVGLLPACLAGLFIVLAIAGWIVAASLSF